MKIKIKKSDYLNAMNRLSEKGLAKGVYYNSNDGSSCLLGHMISIVKNRTPGSQSQAGTDISHSMGFTFTDVTAFNDDPETTPDEVQTFLAFGAAGAFVGQRSPSA